MKGALIATAVLILLLIGAGLTVITERISNVGQISITEVENVETGSEAVCIENEGAVGIEKEIVASDGGMEKSEEMLLVGSSCVKEELVIWRNASIELQKYIETADIEKSLDLRGYGTGFKYLLFASDNWIHEKGYLNLSPLPTPPPDDDC